jgi:hypothetical protein
VGLGVEVVVADEAGLVHGLANANVCVENGAGVEPGAEVVVAGEAVVPSVVSGLEWWKPVSPTRARVFSPSLLPALSSSSRTRISHGWAPVYDVPFHSSRCVDRHHQGIRSSSIGASCRCKCCRQALCRRTEVC